MAIDYKQILATASEHLAQLSGHVFDVLTVAPPPDPEYAILLSKIVSKLSPFVGNAIEYKVVSELNLREGWPEGKWVRQDPGFPDTIFEGKILPIPGIEIKTWFPLATEITARFKDSITHFAEDQTNVAMLAWIPESVIYGKPKILNVWVADAKSVAEARDKHYHNPPDYLVFEPEDTSARTKNLQQTNTNGYKFQGTASQLNEAKTVVAQWGPGGRTYNHSSEYQTKIASLLGQFKYRLDTNYAKMDRIEHPTLEQFKTRVMRTEYNGRTIQEWTLILAEPERIPHVRAIQELCKFKAV